MANVKRTMQVIQKSIGQINARYGMAINNVEDILKVSTNSWDLINYGFRFGYMQGKKQLKQK